MLEPGDFVTEIEWWEHEEFESKNALAAAEVVAFEILNPALRSRGNTTTQATVTSEGVKLRKQMKRLFKGEPSGRVDLPTLEAALNRIEKLEELIRRMGE